MFGRVASNVGALWCGLAHQSVMWPVHGHYECRTCGRRYPAFMEPPLGTAPARRPAVKPALPLIIGALLACLAFRANAAVEAKRPVPAEAQPALERYAGGGAASWAIESIKIHAALTRMQKTGQWLERASIRRVAVTRENALRDGLQERRLTSMTVETRLAGRAELVVDEHPLGPEETAAWGCEGGQQ